MPAPPAARAPAADSPGAVQVRTGVDLVELERFARAWRNGGDAFERRLFHPSERADRRPEHLAGVFAVKEAAAKALDLPAGAWLVMEVVRSRSGKPHLRLDDPAGRRVLSSDISVSYAGGYVMAVCVALCREGATDAAQPR
jgi:phosphopantetheine--protein transferase-like protein